MVDQTTRNSLSQLEKELDDFLNECANCDDCGEVLDEDMICPDHGSAWDQVYKFHYEVLQNNKQLGDSVNHE